jgi:hypothetical protein
MENRFGKTELIERIRRSWDFLEESVAAMSEHELTGIRSPEGWAVKDHLAHLDAWEAGVAALLAKQPRHAAMGLEKPSDLRLGEDEINDIIFKHTRHLPLAEVQSSLRRTHQRMVEAIARMSDEDLYRPYSHYATPGSPGEHRSNPVIEAIIGNTYEHFDSHVEWAQALVKGAE